MPSEHFSKHHSITVKLGMVLFCKARWRRFSSQPPSSFSHHDAATYRCMDGVWIDCSVVQSPRPDFKMTVYSRVCLQEAVLFAVCRRESESCSGTRGSGTEKITATSCTRTGSSWTNRSMVSERRFHTSGECCYLTSSIILTLLLVFCRFHRQTHDSQNALARHRLRGSWEGGSRCGETFHPAVELHQGQRSHSSR